VTFVVETYNPRTGDIFTRIMRADYLMAHLDAQTQANIHMRPSQVERHPAAVRLYSDKLQPNSKLTWADAHEVRRLWARDGIRTEVIESKADLARRFDVSTHTITAILDNRSWKIEEYQP